MFFFILLLFFNKISNSSFNLFISRCIGKSSSETRLYYHAPNSYQHDKEKDFEDESYLNVRASYLSGQDIYGDAILATIGYMWKSCDLFHEDVSPRAYYRFLLLILLLLDYILEVAI